jgi:ubiquinone/menaquinone biosynthesis C-methylase UbiE
MTFRLLRAKRGERRSSAPADEWFDSHIDAARQVMSFLDGAGLSLKGLDVGDVGTGDGIIALALSSEAGPKRLTGWDVNPVDQDSLLHRPRARGYCDAMPSNLAFVVSEPERLPAADGSIDAVVTWSAFEHIGDILALAREIKRVLAPGGFVFAQVWPLYYSERGSHLEKWWPEGFHHLHETQDELRQRVDDGEGTSAWKDYMWSEYLALNGARLDDVQEAFLRTGLIVRRCELYSHLVDIPEPVAGSHRLSDLMIAGFKMILTRPSVGSLN